MDSANSGLGAWTLVGGAGEKSLEASDSQRRLGTCREVYDGKGNIFLISHRQRCPKTLVRGGVNRLGHYIQALSPRSHIKNQQRRPGHPLVLILEEVGRIPEHSFFNRVIKAIHVSLFGVGWAELGVEGKEKGSDGLWEG